MRYLKSKPIGKALRGIFSAFVFSAALTAVAASDGTPSRPVKVACVGNSITFGYGLPDRATQSYPSLLQKTLGDAYEVGNFGHSGATLLKKGHNPYVKTPEYAASKEFAPDIVVILLGINDTDPLNWPNYGDEFVSDYIDLINSYREINPQVRVIIARVTPVTARHRRFRSGTRDWRIEVQKAIENVAEATGVELIDLEAPLRDYPNYFRDAVHPDVNGAKILASTVYSGLTGEYGGLKLPIIYTDSMVIQRNRPLKIAGTANAGSRVALTLDSHTYRTQADNRGQWAVTTAPLTAVGPYEMTVSDGDSTITIRDILAGEVWLASGQSNMAFMINEGIEAEELKKVLADPKLRFFDMKRVVLTSNNSEWSEEEKAQVDSLQYYRPTHWTTSYPATVDNMSAVGYFFGKMLRDSLDVPVGIISNAVGGSTTCSWIDMATLERDIPEATVNWLTNDYIQPWAQGRAIVNMGADDYSHRHSFEPGYLFGAGIRPLGSYPLKGIIWYQGESNAHNPMIHDQLFESLVDSWRREFADPEMPFYFAQLSSINRPSWPEFRNRQRLLAERIPNTAMVVTSDHGDPWDVHPRNKRPVGERLARQALNRLYGFTDLTPAGPEPVAAVSADGAIYITFNNAAGLHPSSGDALTTFEVASTDGLYRPATAEILPDNRIKVYSMDISSPRYVRYGWQPYTEANLVNGDNLPASTFKMEAGNLEMFKPEDGIEYGVSAAYGGVIDGLAVVVGGCNFPTLDPLGPGASKRFYKGVYTGCPDGDGFKWELVGAMDEAKAYGAAVSIPAGVGGNTSSAVLFIGGTGSDGAPLSDVELLRLNPVRFEKLPSLPVAIDNMAACRAGSKVYVAGGNVAGVPSRSMYVLDLDAVDGGWKKLRDFPGNPRVQPVMAADSEGDVYLWGGFAGKGEKREASLDTEGLKYSPKSGKWTTVAGPRNAAGEAVSLGGGAMTVLPDGRFAVIGGVNKDVFLEALRNQAPDYLMHPNEWYRFNPALYIFNPAKGEWTKGPEDAELARAGATFLALPDGSMVVYGGELKPRIRSNQTTLIQSL
ncbi:MAG: cyclically-permuted mutarotase family protein [Paramuribaculum sp.]|nr:cyclically-permuted mutarotase family protein [Paramuribaculum sp.]